MLSENESRIRDLMIKECETFAREHPIYSRAMASTIKQLNLNEPLEFSFERVDRMRMNGNARTIDEFTAGFYTIANHYELFVTVRGLIITHTFDYGRE